MTKQEVEKALVETANRLLQISLPEMPEEVRQHVAAIVRRASNDIRTARIPFKGSSSES
jgi:hypothetical protein